ncbi:uncharacterized protein LOC123563241 isoform X2 [Mercenaria mercenaria]|uniref:uncharacterized protein LOC123563241 isoform X2 n=1 Tax=Mercenaria mercenaria TaxID=6596 RepID=UPI00234E7F9B|nr:uncharacterized protein LOC123563241 isoform X2 [Mercenaria mercenaria]
MADTGSTDSSERCKEKTSDGESQFLMIDYEEQIARELEDVRNELYKQITSVATKLNLLWEVVRSMIVFIIPVVTGIGISVLSQTYLPKTLAVISSSICNGITIGLVFLNLTPLNEAITSFIDSRIYTPNFVTCKCKTCHDKNNCNKEQHEQKQDKTVTGPDTTSEHQDESDLSSTNSAETVISNSAETVISNTSGTVISNTAGNVAGDNDETFRRRCVDTEYLNQH